MTKARRNSIRSPSGPPGEGRECEIVTHSLVKYKSNLLERIHVDSDKNLCKIARSSIFGEILTFEQMNDYRILPSNSPGGF